MMRNKSIYQSVKRHLRVLTLAILSMLIVALPATSHEIEPSIVNVSIQETELNLSVELSLEAVLSGIDLSSATNTTGAANEEEYDRLRALSPEELKRILNSKKGALEDKFHIYFNDIKADINLTESDIPVVGDIDLSRVSTLYLTAIIPPKASEFQFGWAADLGLMVLRREAENGGFAGYVEPGDLSPPLSISQAEQPSNLSVFTQFIPVGFDHILPKGLDHILFVVGLFLFSARFKPLLWQVTAFTLAHTVTLALATLNVITVSASIVEPLIAISITYVAVENIFRAQLSPWRPALIFAFGLLHGLGFASVLSDFGLPGAGLVYALIGFNIGVELGQLVVIGICFVLVGYWFKDKSWYRTWITVPASAVIAAIGLWWSFERVFL